MGVSGNFHEGRKDDQDKLPWHLLPPDALDPIVWVLQHGAEKYGGRNWELGMHWSRPFSALMRHMWAWWRGEAVDPDTGITHLAHAGCCILFLLAYEQRGIGTDDRPSNTVPEPRARVVAPVEDVDTRMVDQSKYPSLDALRRAAERADELPYDQRGARGA